MNISINKILILSESVNKKLTVFTLVFFILTTSLFPYWDKITDIPVQYRNNRGWLEFWFLTSDPNYGWICGFEGKVIRTTDKGRTWNGTSIPGANQLESICFPDKLVGYVSGTKTTYINGYLAEIGAIYKSVDGGATWREITPALRDNLLWGNWFLDRDNGIVVGGACGTPLQFFRTKDGGKTWSLFEERAYNNTSLSDVQLNPDGTGYAVSSGHLWKTTDGGYTWKHWTITGEEDWQEDLHVVGNTILLPYSTGCDGNLDNGGIRTSSDFGKTWKDFPTGNAMFGAWLDDNNRGWACGHNASCYYTPNAGQTWELRNCGIDDGEVLDDFWFIDDTTGFVCGKEVYRYAIPKNIKTKILSNNLIPCEGDTIILSSDGFYNHYNWSTGSTDSSIKITKSGKYELVVYNSICDTVHSDLINIVFNPKPQLELFIDRQPVICEGDSIVLHARSNTKDIIWSTGEKGDSIIVKTEGTYSVTAKNESGCSKTTNIFIRVSALPKPKLTLIGRSKFCIGDSTEIIATAGYRRYYWSDGNGNTIITSTNSIKVGKSGIYKCKAENDDNCLGGGLDSIVITVLMERNRLAFVKSKNEVFSLDSAYFPEYICKNIEIFNPTTKDQTINLPYLLQNKSFSFPLSQFPILVQAGDTVNLKVCYSPTKLGVELDTMIIDDICNPHYINLKGFSIAKSYESSSVCDAPMVAKIIELPQKYSFSTQEPSPNPAVQLISVKYTGSSNDNSIPEETAELYDMFGIRLITAINNIISEEETNGIKKKIGEFIFNINSIESGTYLIVIRTQPGIISYKQMIIK